MKVASVATGLIAAGALLATPALAYPGPHDVPGFTVTDYVNNLGGGPVELSFDASGNLYAGHDLMYFGGNGADPAKIFKIGPGGAPVTLYGNDPIYDADAVLWDGNGYFNGVPGTVLVAGYSGGVGGQISAIDPVDQSVSVVFGPEANMENPNSMAFDAMNRLIVGDNDGEVYRVDGGTATLLFDVGPDGGGFALNPTRDLIYTRFEDTIRVYDLDGNLVDGNFVSGREIWHLFFGPGDSVWGSDLYGLDKDTGELLRIDEFGSISEIGTNFGTGPVAGGGDGRVPGDFTFGADGALYHSIVNEGRIIRIIPEPASLALLGLAGLVVLRRRN